KCDLQFEAGCTQLKLSEKIYLIVYALKLGAPSLKAIEKHHQKETLALVFQKRGLCIDDQLYIKMATPHPGSSISDRTQHPSQNGNFQTKVYFIKSGIAFPFYI